MTPFARRLAQAASSQISGGGGGSGHGPGAVSHGDEITSGNVGYTAWHDNTLGRTLVLGDLQTIGGTHYVSDFMVPGGTLYMKNFTGDIIIDIDNVTLLACNFVNPVSGFLSGNHATGWAVEYCTLDVGPGVGDNGLQYESYTARRCYIAGCSDGAKVNGGGTVVEECYIRTKAQDPLDHNDGLQNVGGAGNVTIRRCNIDCRPIGGSGGPNAAIFSADGPTNGTFLAEDNLLAGGSYTLGLSDGTVASNFFYTATGNKIVRGSFINGPAQRTLTDNANITWSNNTYSDNAEVIPLP